MRDIEFVRAACLYLAMLAAAAVLLMLAWNFIVANADGLIELAAQLMEPR